MMRCSDRCWRVSRGCCRGSVDVELIATGLLQNLVLVTSILRDALHVIALESTPVRVDILALRKRLQSCLHATHDYAQDQRLSAGCEMASTTAIRSLTDELVTLLVPTSIAPVKLRRAKDTFSRKLRHHAYGRTNQFEVSGRLDGLQERFLVSNNEDLEAAFHDRLKELESAEDYSICQKWLPDVLHLLLELSDDPTNKTKLANYSRQKSFFKEEPKLKWAEVEADDPIDRRDQIWRRPSFSDLSSEADEFETTRSSSPTTVEGIEKPLSHDSYFINELANDSERSEHTSHQQAKASPDDEPVVSEQHLLREVLFMLRCVPTNTFKKRGSTFEINRNVYTGRVSDETVRELLISLVAIGEQALFVRQWLGKPQNFSFIQTMQTGIEGILQEFDAAVSSLESRLLNPSWLKLATLAVLHDDIKESSLSLDTVAGFVRQTERHSIDEIGSLELLYELTCSEQVAGSHRAVQHLWPLFLNAFQSYLVPLTRWIESGEIDSHQHPTFVGSLKDAPNPSHLWLGWYAMDDGNGPTRVPKFLRRAAKRIFTVGKMRAFLGHLSSSNQLQPAERTRGFLLKPLKSIDLTTLAPLTDSFGSAIDSALRPCEVACSTMLRDKLGNECGLWRWLDAAEHVFFAKYGHLADTLEARIFEKLDKGSPTWNDKYLLQDLLESIYAIPGAVIVDVGQIRINVKHLGRARLERQRRSVAILENLSFDYLPPWPVANIIPNGSRNSYRRVALFLMQIRRARFSLERQCHEAVMTRSLDMNHGDHCLAQKTHCNLLHFVNVLYDHLTSLVINSTTLQMRKKLSQAVDIDEMIQVHENYMVDLEEGCLVAKRIAPVRVAIVAVLDLCIRFSDVVTTPSQTRLPDHEARSFVSAVSRPQRRHRGGNSVADSSEEDEDEEDEAQEGFSTFVTFDEATYQGHLKDIKQQLKRHHGFIVAGLSSMARVAKDGTAWEILAGRLESDK